jgi:hypothetical protein
VLASVGALVGVALIALASSVSSGDTSKFLGLKDNPDLYAYYLGHLFDLTPESLRALRLPLAMAGVGLGVTLPLHYAIKSTRAKAAILATGMVIFFTAANVSLLIFAPRLTSEPLAREINRRLDSSSIIIIDGEYEEGSSVAFYTGRVVLLHNAPSSNLEYGSRYPDAPPLFVNDDRLRQLWGETDKRIFLVTFEAKRQQLESTIPATRFTIGTYGDKILMSNLPDRAQFSKSPSHRTERL